MANIAAPPKFERIMADVGEYIRTHPGATRSEVGAMIVGSHGSIVFAIDKLISDGRVEQRGRKLHPVKRASR